MSTASNDSTSALPSWDGPAIGLLDLDAFFAAVEYLDHPAWRGKPLIVGGRADKRGVVATASYEARRYGVHSAMPSAQAERLCPDAIWTEGHFDRYREMSAKVMAIIADETPLVEQVSIDEAFFDVSPGRYSRESPVSICQRIQGRVAELGITCSIGLGANKTVAKIASDLDKPRGLTIVWPGREHAFLAPLPVRQMSGIGEATARHLTELGISTLGDLAEADPATMRSHFGVAGPRMVERAQGAEISQVAAIDAPEDVKSVSHERTFAEDLTSEEDICRAIDYVAELVARRLRAKHLAGTTVTLKLKYDALHTRTARTQLPQPSAEASEFAPVARDLLHSIWRAGMGVRLVGVAISGFSSEAAGRQLALFDGGENSELSSAELLEREQLSHTADAVRERFGKDAVMYGRDLRIAGHTTKSDKNS